MSVPPRAEADHPGVRSLSRLFSRDPDGIKYGFPANTLRGSAAAGGGGSTIQSTSTSRTCSGLSWSEGESNMIFICKEGETIVCTISLQAAF